MAASRESSERSTFNASQIMIHERVAGEESYPVHKPIARSLDVCPSMISAGRNYTYGQCSYKPQMRTSASAHSHLAWPTDD